MSKKKFKERKATKDKEEKNVLYKIILDLFKDNPRKSFDFGQIARKAGAKKKALNKEITNVLNRLEEEGQIRHLDDGNFTTARRSDVVEGTVDHVNPRFAYIVTGIEGRKDIYVKTPDLNTALHGDRVEVELFRKRSGENPEGRVTNITKRARNKFVGRLELTKNYGFVVPDFKKIYQDFFIYPENIGGAQSNDKVVFEVTRWSDGDKSPEAKVVEILGKTGENEAEIHSIMAEFELPFRFPNRSWRSPELFRPTSRLRK